MRCTWTLLFGLFGAAAWAQQTERDLTYLSARSQAPALRMDLVKPDGSGPFPVVLLIHGGGFEKGSARDMTPVAVQLQRAGIASAMASYRLAPRFQFPGQVHDLKAAVRFLRSNASRFSLQTDRICALGEEAGGTLALFLGFTRGIAKFEGRTEYQEFPSAVDCVVSVNPLDGKVPAFAGGEYATRMTRAVQWVTPEAAPVLSIAGPAGDAEAKLLMHRLHDVGVDARSVAASGKALPAEAVQFLQEHLKPPPDRWTVLLSDHGPAAQLVAIGWPSGKVLWRVPNGTGLDVQALPDGHVLFTNHAAHRVVEIDGQQKEVWSLGAEAGLTTPYSVRRLSNGSTLVGDAQGARVTEFTPQGSVAWKWEKPEMAELWPRMSRPTNAGTVLVTFQKGGAVLEVNREGKTIWEYKIDPSRLPYQALRLTSGNTLIGLVDPGEVIEVDQKGKTVRSVGGTKSDLRFGWIAGIDVLPSGGLMIADFTSRRVVEVDAAGKLVHELRDLPWSVASIAVMPSPR